MNKLNKEELDFLYRRYLAGWGKNPYEAPVRGNNAKHKRILFNKHKLTVFGHFMAPCTYCGILCKESVITVDHVIPLSRKGSDKITNKVLACKPCNEKKANNLLSELD